jgi:hypothetical protein
MAASNNYVQDLYLDPVFQAFSMGIGINDPDRMDRVHPPFLFFEFENMSCFLRRNIISICLNTSGIPLTFNGDVKSRAECQFILALLLLAAGYPTMLDVVGPPLYKPPAPSHQGLIRWPVGDEAQYHADNWRFTRLSSSTGIEYIRRESMALDLFVFQRRPRLPADQYAAAVKAWSIAHEYECTFMNIATLAVALDIGLDMMVQKVRAFYDETPTMLTQSRERSIAGVDRYMSKGHNTTAENDIRTVADIISNTLPHFRNVKRSVPLIAQLDHEGTRHALLFVPSRLLRNDQGNLHIPEYTYAVPAAHNIPTAACTRRLWILADSKTVENSMAIVGQGYYFGETLTAGSEVAYAEGVKVVGRWVEDGDGYDSEDEWAGAPEI